jgi:DNA-binding transcriptional LysR family regulator
VGFKPRIVKEADGAASALAFVAAGFGVAVVSEPLQKIPAKDVIFRDLALEDRAWVPVGAAWKPDAVSAPVASQFIDVLAQSCANGGEAAGIWNRSIELMRVDFTNNASVDFS